MATFSNTPADRFPKNGQDSKEEYTAGHKCIKDDRIRIGQAADIGPAPPSRVYSRDYSKRDPDGDQHDDTLSPFIGNPLGL